MSSHPPYGALPHVAPDNLYFARHGGHLYTCPYIETPRCIPHWASIIITACGKPFAMTLGESRGSSRRTEQAVAVSCAPRSLSANNVKLLVAHVGPLHPAYRALQCIPSPGLLSLDRARFRAIEDQMNRAFYGRLSPLEASCLYDEIVRLADRALPQPRSTDGRLHRWLTTLRQDPTLSLRTLASESGLSYQHMSRIFADAVGISLRQFQLWQKLDRVRRVYLEHDNLTDIAHAAGFSDLAHMTRVFQRNYGAPPSYFFRNPNVRIFGAVDANERVRMVPSASHRPANANVALAARVSGVTDRAVLAC